MPKTLNEYKKTHLEEYEDLKCPLCDEMVEACGKCGDYPSLGEEWYCKNDGDEHFCPDCYEEIGSGN
jgi:hypothetical protein